MVIPRPRHRNNSPVYRAAFHAAAAIPVGQMNAGGQANADQLPDALTVQGATPASNLSAVSQVFLAAQPADSMATIRLVGPKDPAQSVFTTLEETEGFLQYVWLRQNPGPVKIGDLARRLRDEALTGSGFRHQWAVAGGDLRSLIENPAPVPAGLPMQSPPDRMAADYVGHLQYCLETTDFPAS
jgi:hypothetical protein